MLTAVTQKQKSRIALMSSFMLTRLQSGLKLGLASFHILKRGFLVAIVEIFVNVVLWRR